MIISTEFENTHYGVQEAAGSNPVTRTTSEQISLCSGVFFCLRQKRRHPLRYICPSSQNRTRCAGLRFCFLLCAHMLLAGCLSARAKSYVKSRKYLFPAICPDFFRCEGAFFAFFRLLPHVGLFQRAARSSCGSFFISALPLTCVSHAHVSGFSTDEGE